MYHFMRSGSYICTAAVFSAVTSFAQAQTVFDAPAPFTGDVSISGAERGPLYPGTTAQVSGSGFAAGQVITFERGDTVLVEPTKADEKGEFTASFDIPADAALGQHPVVIKTEAPDSAEIYDLKVSPKIDFFGQDKFETTKKQLSGNLYQVAISEANGTLFVTSAVGRPPVKESTIFKLDATTLEVLGEITPANVSDDGGVYAVYGVGVDDANGNIWVTNSRQNTVAVYAQADLSLVKQFPAETAAHARDAVFDAARGRVYVSAEVGVLVFDAKTLELLETIAIKSNLRRETFNPMSLALNAANGSLYTVSLSTPEAAVINLETGDVKVWALEGVDRAVGVDVSEDGSRIFAVAQGSDDLLIMDADGKLLKRVMVGAQPLNVVYEDKSKLAFVVNRASESLAVVSLEGEIVANLPIGPLANFVEENKAGVIYAVSKSRGDAADGNTVWRLTVK